MSGFDEDPQFEIIYMPDEEGQESTGEMDESEEDLDRLDGSDRTMEQA